MTAYYNENDPYAAQWLRNLIEAGHIAPGEVDERSIVDVRPSDLVGFVQAHFFAGIGGWSRALRIAGWPDNRPVWTGSCPCQPFSLADAQRGFADERHLWPVWRSLIGERHPAKVFGEQVASATEWLRLVRSDLEALGYAVGAIPIQAASAGADHLRDRFWIVADRAGEQVGTAGQSWRGGDVVDHSRNGRGEGRPEHAVRSRRNAAAGDGGAGDNLADSAIFAERESTNETDAIADGRETRALPCGSGATRNVGDCHGGRRPPWNETASTTRYGRPASSDDSGFEWVIGADGKARRVKPGIRLLAHGIPARVGKLRGFGNAIDPRPAAAFIRAASDAMTISPS